MPRSTLRVGDCLRAEETLVSNDGSTVLEMGRDGALVLSRVDPSDGTKTMLWTSSSTPGSDGDHFATVLPEGAIAVLAGTPERIGDRMWRSGSAATASNGRDGQPVLTVMDGGSLVLKGEGEDDPVLWAARAFRVLTYNAHILMGSAVERGGDVFGHGPLSFRDEERYGRILEAIIRSGADIVAIQEVWSASFMQRMLDDLRGVYRYSHRGSNGSGLKAGSGILMFSRFPFDQGEFYEFLGGPDIDEQMATKGVLSASVDLQDGGDVRVRFGVSHCWTDGGGDHLTNIKDIIGRTVQPDFPAVMLGDFNVHLKGDRRKFDTMHDLFQSVKAFDTWEILHGPAWTEERATIDQAANPLDDFFSTVRDTPTSDCIDFVFVRDTPLGNLRVVDARVLRDWKAPIHGLPVWYWAHPGLTINATTAAEHRGDVHAVHMDTRMPGVVRNGAVMIATLDVRTRKWTHRTVSDSRGEIETTGAPGIVSFADRLHLFFTVGREVFKMESDDGIRWTDRQSQGAGFQSSGGVFPVVHDGALYVFVRDPTGGAVYYHKWTNRWSDRQWVGINTSHDVAAASGGGVLCVVTKDGGGGGVMRAVLSKEGKWNADQIKHVVCSGSPAVVHDGKAFHVFYRDPDGGGVMHRSSPDGLSWGAQDFTGHATVDAVGALWTGGHAMLFYGIASSPDNKAYRNGALTHGYYPPEVDLDHSDHFPYMVDMVWSRYE